MPASVGLQPESLSNEVLKLKIDDLFQELEVLKRRVERLESQPSSSQARGCEPKLSVQARGVVSDPDRPL